MFLSFGALSQPFTNMPNGNGSNSITSCNRQIRDHHGNGNYGNNQNSTLTICSGSAAQYINLNFTQFNLETNYDFLAVYAGPTATGTPLLNLTGNALAVTNYAIPSNCVTLVFTSDNSVTRPGFRVTVSCYSQPTCTDGIQNGTETGVDCGGCDGCPPCPLAATPATVTATASTLILPCGGGPVDLLATGVSATPVLVSNFDAGNPGAGWNFTGSGMFTNPCGPSPSSTTHLWFGNASPHPRQLTTNGLDLTCGGNICFDFKMATQGGNGSCEGPDLPNEGVTLSYSTDCGLTFQNIAYFHPNGTVIGANPGTTTPGINGATNFTTWNNYCFPIPAAAQTPNTIIQWGQLATSGANYDHWGLDEVVVTANNCNPYYYDWAHVAGAPNPAGNTANITSTTTFDVIYTNGIDDTASASLTVIVDGPVNSTVTTTPVDYCVGVTSGTATLTGNGTTNPPYTFVVAGPAGYTSTTNGIPSSTITGLAVGNYTVTTSDATGCTIVDTFSIVGGPFCCDVAISQVDLTCNSADAACNGSTQALPTNGLAPYSYQWHTGGSANNPIVGQTSQSMGSLCAGTYTVMMTDQTGCIDSATVTVVEPTALTLSGITTDVSCFTDTDGTLSVTAGGGTPTYNYTLGTTTNSTGNFATLSQGSYTVTATDINGCSINTTLSIVEPPLLNFVINNVSNAFCAVNNGVINISATGGTGPYNYDIGGGNSNTTGIFTGLAPNSYAVIITDANGCSVTTYLIIINSIPNPILNIDSVLHETCFGSNSGSIYVSVTGQLPSFAYNYSINGNTPTLSNIFTGLSAGAYNIVVTDVNGCADSTIVTVTSPPLLSASIVQTNVSCNSECDGTITPTITGGTPPYLYSLNGGVTFDNPPLTGLCAGTYFYVVQDSNGCLANQTVIITEPAPISFTGVETPSTCGISNGIFTLTTATGGSGSGYSFSYDGSPFTTTTVYPILNAGFYWLVVQDGTGCLDSNAILIQNIEAPLLVNTIVIPNLCYGQSLGEIIATATDTSTTVPNPPPYNFSINGGAFAAGNIPGGAGNSFASLPNGLYITQVQDQNGCIRIDTLTISSPPELILNETHADLNCNNDATGFINLIASGGVGPYTYDIGNGQPTNNFGFFSGLSAGSYTPIVTDANGCDTTLPNIIISEPTLLAAIVVATDPQCNAVCDGVITFTASGGTPGYLYSLNNGTSLFASPSFTNVCDGTYNYLIEDNNGCTLTGTTTLTEPPALSVTAISTDASCNTSNGSITATGVGGTGAYTYNLNGGTGQAASLFLGLTSGSYIVQVIDANLCTDTVIQLIGQDGAPTISSITITDVDCFGGTSGDATINAVGGVGPYMYSINGSPSQATPFFPSLAANTYLALLFDANGCATNANFTVAEPSQLMINNPAITNVLCNGASTGSIFLGPSGGTGPYQYSYDGGVTFSSSDNITAITAGTYSIVVVDANGCTETLNITITEPAPITVTPVIANASCFGVCDGQIDLAAAGGTAPLSYNWTFNVAPANSGIANSLCAGTYSAIITDFNGCIINSGDQIVTEPTLVQINSVATTSITCNGLNDGTITISAVGVTSYQINGFSGSQTNTTGIFTNLSVGLYSVTVSDANGCTASSSTIITEPSTMNVISSGNVISCPNTPVTHSANAVGGTPPYAYVWSNSDVGNSTTVSAIGPATFTVTATDANGCVVVSSLAHTVTIPLVIDPIAPISLCEGDSVQVFATAQDGQPDPLTGYTYTWNHLDSSVVTDSAYLTAIGNPSSYWVIVKDMCNDFDSTEVQVFAFQEPVLTLTGPVDGCSPQLETFTITSTDPLSNCTWDFGDATTGTGCGTITHNYATPGVYTVQFDFEAFNSCPFDTTFTNVLEIYQNPIINSVVLTDPLCNSSADGAITLTGSLGTPIYDYQLNAGALQTPNVFNGLTSGAYTATIVDQNGCTADTNVSLVDPPALSFASINITDVLCFGDLTGSIVVTAAGGTPGYTYSFDAGATYGTSSTSSSLPAGTYNVFIQDTNGCTVDSMNVIIAQPNELVIDLVSVTNASCFNVCDGSIFVGFTGGTIPITYTWSANAATGNINTANALCDGSYDVTLTDGNSCSVDSLNILISEPPQIVITSLVVDSVSCFAAADGEITIAATNGDTYELTGPMPTVTNATGTFPGLIPGTYTITVFDVNSCSIDTVVNIFEPTVLAMTNSGDTTVCYSDAITHTATVTGGTLPYSITWDTGATGPTLTYTALQDTAITVTVTDANGCTVAAQTINITVIPLLTIDPIADQTLCIGDSVLTTATAQDGLAPYIYQWNNLPIGNNTNPQFLMGTNNPNVYWVSVTDGCNDVDSTQVNVFDFQAPTFNLTGPFDGCAPQNETFNIVGASAPISNCSWDFGNTLTALGCGPQTSLYNTAGVYSVTFSYDAFGCSFDTTFVNVLEIFENPIIDSIDFENPTCFGAIDGQLTIYTSLGNGPYSYQLGAGAITLNNNFTGLGAGFYSYTVSDINNCVASDFVTLIEPPILTIDQVVIVDALCNADTTGSITVTATGGTTPYQYSFDGGVTYSTNNVNSNLASGNYTVFVQDSNMCTVDSMNIFVGQPAPVLFDFVNVVDASCFGICDGTITIGAIGGGAPYTYSWSANAATGDNPLAIALCADTYTATITDANGCSVDSVGITVNEPPQITITSIVTDTVSCFGGADAVATITATNAVNYEITGPVNASQASNIFTGLSIGTYALQLTDANGCTMDTTFTVLEPTPVLFNSVVTTSNLCNGDNTGSITIGATGGTSPYTYSFDGGVTYGVSNTDMTLAAGIYDVSIQDANGCVVDSIGVIITEPTAVTIDVVAITDALCFGDSTGAITITASGGTAPYLYSFDAGVTYSTSNSSTNLPAGTYHIFVLDTNQCTADSINVIIGEPTPVQFDFVTVVDASCFGVCDGTITIGAIGGAGPYSYGWSANAATGNNPVAVALCAGAYTATITDANGCSVDSVGILVNEPPQITITSIVTDTVSCFGGADAVATITAVNAVNFEITGPVNANQASNIFNGLSTGAYALQLTDANGCTMDTTFTILEPTPVIFNSITITSNLCNGDNTGGITIGASGGTAPYTYSFDGGGSYGTADTNMLIAAGPYNLSIQDANGCTVDSIGVIVTEPTPLVVDLMAITDASCFSLCDGVITATVSGGVGGYNYSWSANATTGNTNTAIGLCADSYDLQITDANGCVLDTNNNVVNEPAQVIFISVTTDSVNCFGASDGQINVTATNATGFSLNGAPAQATGLFPGLATGFYTITITGVNGCSAISDTTIYEPTLLTISTGNDTTVCANTNANLFGFANGGIAPYTFQWTGLAANANQIVTPAVTTTYALNVVDANGCPAGPANTTVTVFDALTADPLVDATVCPGESSTINANVTAGVPVYTYAWSPAPNSGQGTPSADLAVGSYNLLITDNCGATVNQTVNVNTFVEPTFAFLGVNDGCAPHTVTVDPNNGTVSNCSWTFGNGATANGCGPTTYTYNDPGMYDINFSYTSVDGCQYDTLMTNAVTVSPTPIASFTFNPAKPSLTNNTVTFTNTSIGGSTYSWTFGVDGVSSAQNPIYQFPSTDPADYDICLTVTDVYPGYVCESTVCEIIPLEEEFSIYVPNAFTPNGNEHNNEFRPIILGERTDSFEMLIFNRWGEVVYESRDHQIGWDGTYGGKPCPDGAYIWKIKLKDKNVDDVKTFTGHVMILR